MENSQEIEYTSVNKGGPTKERMIKKKEIKQKGKTKRKKKNKEENIKGDKEIMIIKAGTKLCEGRRKIKIGQVC